MANSTTDYQSLAQGEESDAKDDKQSLSNIEKVKDMFSLVKAVLCHGSYAVLCVVIIFIIKTLYVDTNANSETYFGMLIAGVNMTKLYVTILGISVPMLLSLNALVTLDTDDDRYWLTYWAVYATYTFLTIIFEEILFEDTWLWYAVQGSVYVWLYLPGLDGCLVISKLFLKPYVLPWIYRASSWVKSKVTLKRKGT
eukprot:jgi/Bigna1/75566/fgenesh1_pg.35_\